MLQKSILKQRAEPKATAIDTWDRATRKVKLEEVLRSTLPADATVLDAGGGDRTHVALPPNAELSVIDQSPEQLKKNQIAHHKILGDICTHDLSGLCFDLIVVWDVLEHLDDPEGALANLFKGTSGRSVVIIAGPIVLSAKSIITKFTPHWFHVFAYRHVFGSKTAGQPGYAPFPTYLRLAAQPENLIQFARSKGFERILFAKYPSRLVEEGLKKKRLAYAFYALFSRLISICSLNKIERRNTDFILVLRKETS